MSYPDPKMGKLPFEIQLRSETTGQRDVKTMKEAVEETIKDPTIWKISFWLPTGERFRATKDQQTKQWLLNLIDYEGIEKKAKEKSP